MPVLSDLAKEILKKAASGDGSIIIVRLKGEIIVQCGGNDSSSIKRTGRTEADLEKALSELEAAGLIKRNNPEGTSLSVTAEGYSYADQEDENE